MKEDKDLNITTTNEVQTDLVNLALQSLEQMTAKEIQPKYENTLVNTEVEVLDIPETIPVSYPLVTIPNSKKILKKKKKFPIIIISIFIICAILFGIYYFFLHTKLIPEITMEVGNEPIQISQFYQNMRIPKDTHFLSDISSIDFTKVQDHELMIQEKNKVKTVVLHLVDTKPPVVEFQDIIRNIDYVISPDDFIVEKEDFSDMTVKIDNNIQINEYKDYSVKVSVSDSYGNTTSNNCLLRISVIKPEYHLELGKKLSKKDLLYDLVQYQDYINQEDINKINSSAVGEYEIKTNINQIDFITKIIVSDTQAPKLTLKNITIFNTDPLPDYQAFISSISDASSYTTTLKTKIDAKKIGTQTVKIEAKDVYNNVIEKEATLTIKNDTQGPKFSGLNTITINKNTIVDYNTGVTAIDNKDGKVTFAVDSSQVDITKSGTYYATYTASDSSQNKTTEKRKIVVNRDIDDTNAKLDEFAKSCGTDYESLRQCVAKQIRYNSNWGGDDPIWYGLTQYKGNCYVHALIYKALLEKNGYQTQIIWTTNKSHYWNLVYINGVWRHSDATPTQAHNMISAATDAERYEHLQGRNWDRSLWPEAK